MNPNPGQPHAAEPDPGTPIAILKELDHETSARFVARVRGRIHRRAATTQFAAFSWHLPKSTLLEMARLLTHILQSFGAPKER